MSDAAPVTDGSPGVPTPERRLNPFRRRPATAVGTGIFLSRLTGLARDSALAAFLGTGLLADAYWAAIKIPNIIRNLLGEGTLSAAFVPVYSETLERHGGSSEESNRLASSVLGIVLTAAVLLSALGVILAPWITSVVMVGAGEETRRVTTELVRILFPMSGALIVGAWFLGVLNSHGKFFLPFVAPGSFSGLLPAQGRRQLQGCLFLWPHWSAPFIAILRSPSWRGISSRSNRRQLWRATRGLCGGRRRG